MTNEEEEYYIICTNHESLWPRGVLLFWGPNGNNYSSTLELAGKYTREKARKIEGYRGGDYAVPCSVIEVHARRIVDIDLIPSLKEFSDAAQRKGE